MAYDPMEVWENHFGSKTEVKDFCGATIYKSAHDNPNSRYGWEVDHIIPASRGGTDHLSNLRPLHWENNDAKGDALDGFWTCARTSPGWFGL